jgi:integrase
MATPQCNFTERALDTWVKQTLDGWRGDPTCVPPTGEALIRDRGGPASVPGLCLRLRLGRAGDGWTVDDPAAGFYLLRKVRGRKVNRLIGDRRVLSVETARAEATALMQKFVSGKDPREERRKAKEVRELQALTFRTALETFLEEADIADGTRVKYRQALTTTFKEVADKPLTYFTPERVREMHKARSEQSRSRADQDMRVLRLLWNWARRRQTTADGEAVLGENPVGALNKRGRGPGQRGWNNVPRKQSIIPRGRLPDWLGALRKVPGQSDTSETQRTSCLLLEALALTGLRFNELATLPWSRVDLGMGTVTIPDRTSKNRQPLVRPITRRVREIFKEVGTTDGLVFPGCREGRPLDNTRKLQLELQARTGLWITPHDLRRVWTSAASRAGLPAVAIKRLLNHLTHAEEVTEGYIRLGLDELLEHAQAVEDMILGDAGLLTSRNLDDRLQAVLAALPEVEKRRLLFKLAQRKIQEVG